MVAPFHADEFRKRLMEANLKKEARQSITDEKKNRNIAEQNDKYKPTFLRPNDVAGEYDFKRALKTTLGGLELRDITLADLDAFQRNIETIGTLYKGGITIPQIISLSRGEDIDRANREIHTAQPVSRRAGDIMFITNSGPNSDKPNHVVNVEFLSYDSIVLNPKKEKQSTIKNRLANGKVKIECSCGRFTYWYRYIATLGNFVHGRKEAGFPKERNPDLTGIACKHILRTVHFIRSPLGQTYLRRAIEKDRTKQHGRRYSETARSMAKMLDQQVIQQQSVKHEIKPAVASEVRKLVKRIESQTKVLQQKQSKLDEKDRRIARLKANYAAGLIDKRDFEFYMGVENARKY
ncbi:hypothetical protein [Acinetobacter radioresistens]|uniref:hypothetical protein n=1 Tax=Acinetobacter radioresistens TaxID=40216 RepID=UPI002006758C|nr:hypothetical protein [Acinetobacter radioresistens]MCK4108901.1 hypothetical protein [Acinetobacter radioresistens]